MNLVRRSTIHPPAVYRSIWESRELTHDTGISLPTNMISTLVSEIVGFFIRLILDDEMYCGLSVPA